MQITGTDVITLRIPFDDPGQGTGLFPGAWTAHDFVLLRIETDSGLVGWGEAFSYFCAPAVASVLETAVAPLLIGRDPLDVAAIVADVMHRTHIMGRYGITMFAISAVDIALHDLASKAEGVSLAEWLGGRRQTDLPAYASLIRYGTPDLVDRVATAAVAEGYGTIKLHEIALDPIRAGRAAVGPQVALTNDVNCNWTAQQTRDWAEDLRVLDLMWVEEPTMPPEDFDAMAALRRETGLAIATGENLCTRWQFAQLIAAGGADFVQPSVTKIGGIGETMATRALAHAAGVKIAHHAPYFGPGYLATLQVLATAPEPELFEYLYVKREADMFGNAVKPVNGRVQCPEGRGLGADPDPDILARYRV